MAGKAAAVPAILLLSLLRQQPYLMALGMGGHAGPFAKILAAARWAGSSLPFFFSLLHPSRVLRHLAYARTTRLRRMLADGLAASGLAWTANKLLAGARAVMRGGRRANAHTRWWTDSTPGLITFGSGAVIPTVSLPLATAGRSTRSTPKASGV